MQRKDSILYRTTKDNEDSITELLCNLMREKYVRDILLLNLKIPLEIINDIKLEDISTQLNLLESGKPDICIQNKTILIYIENKIYSHTNLPNNQIISYIEKLKGSKNKHRQMIYLIPKGYIHIDAINFACEQNSFCKIVYWEDFLESVSKYEISESNLVFRECFRFIEDKLLSKSISIKFKIEEIIMMYNTKDLIAANSLFIKLRELLEKANPIIVDELNKVRNDFSHSDWSGFDRGYESENEKGKYLNYKGVSEKIFYGLNFNIVRDKPENKDYLLAVAISLDIIDLNKMGDLINEKDYITDTEWCYIKMDKFNLSEENASEAFANNVIQIIKKILL